MSISPPYRPGAGLLIWLSIVLSAMLSASCQQPPQAAKAEPPPPVPWKTIEPPTQVGVTEGGTPVMAPPVVIGHPYPGTGIVTIVNRKEGWVEINHEEIKGLMPAMQMEWSVKNRSMLKDIRVGDKVDFTVVETGKGEILTELKKVAIP